MPFNRWRKSRLITPAAIIVLTFAAIHHRSTQYCPAGTAISAIVSGSAVRPGSNFVASLLPKSLPTDFRQRNTTNTA